MVRFVCLLLVSFVACSHANDDTLLGKCQGVCKTLGDFIREDESVPSVVHDWLKKNELMEGDWDCQHLLKVGGKVQNMLVTFEDDYSEEEQQHIAKMAKAAMEEMAEPLANTIVDNLSEDCENKYQEILKQIM